MDRNYRLIPTLDIHQPGTHTRRTRRTMGQTQEKVWRSRKLERIREVPPIPVATATTPLRSPLLLYRVWNRVHGGFGSLDTIPQGPKSSHLGLRASSRSRRVKTFA